MRNHKECKNVFCWVLERWKSNFGPMTDRLTVCRGWTNRETQSEARGFRVPGGRLNTGESNQGRGQPQDPGESHTKSQRAEKLGQEEKLEIMQLKVMTIKTKQEAPTNRAHQFGVLQTVSLTFL